MDSIKISFGRHNGFMIQNSRSKSNIITRIQERYKLNIFNMFEKHYGDHLLNVLNTKPMIVCNITRGKPYILYLTKILNENIALLIDLESKNNFIPKIISVPLSASEELFSDTILYGELLRHSQEWTFLIESCKVLKGKSIFHKSALDNLKICSSIVHNSLKPTLLMPFNIKMKQFYPISNIQNVLSNLKYDIIGIKFIGLRIPIAFYLTSKNRNKEQALPITLYPPLSYTHIIDEKKQLKSEFITDSNMNYNSLDSISKLLELNIDIEQPFDLMLKMSDTYGLYNVLCDKGIIGIARVLTIELNLELINVFKHTDHCYVSAYYNHNYNKWDVLHIHYGKVSLSLYSTIESHITSMKTIPKANYLIVQN